MTRLLCLAAALGLTSPSPAADWPQFRGPNAAGAADGRPLPVEWSKEKGIGHHLLPGRGVSSPVIAGDRMYVTCSSGVRDDRLHVVGFRMSTLDRIWSRELVATGSTACHPKSCMAAPTPAADDDGVYALFATGDLVAFDPAGNLRWYRSLVGDYPTVSNQVGMAASPVLAGGRLIVPMDNAGESFLLAVDPKTGANVWKVARPRDINWVTPVVRSAGGVTEILLLGPKGLTAYDAGTGAVRWTYKGDGGGSIATPVLHGDVLILPIGGLRAVKLGPAGVAGDPLWKAAGAATGMPSPLAYDGRVYTVNGSGLVACTDAATGKVVWKDRLKGAYSASPVAGDGKVYFLNETGTTTVVKAGGDAMDVLATNALGGEGMGTPAIDRGVLFIRSDTRLTLIRGPR